jgi:aminoglycoside phosphotransferase (APT) family kinase protein
MVNRLRLPLSVDAVDPHWLTEVLGERYPGTEVIEVESERKIVGFATKVRLRLKYNDAGRRHGLPQSVWLKGGLDECTPGHIPSYIAEARFFADWAPSLQINLPRAYWSAVEEGRQGLVLLEDLDGRGVRYGYATIPVTPDQAKVAVRLLAALHARYWKAAQLASLRSYTDRFGAADYVIAKLLEPQKYRRAVAGRRGETAPALLREPEGMWQALRALWKHTDDGPQCFCHADAHLGNFFFEPDGRAGLLDWQAYLRSHPIFDVGYFLCGALTSEDRRLYERSILEDYLSTLEAAGVKEVPTFDDAWLTYRRFALHGFIWAGAIEGNYADEMTEAYARRYGAACSDLDTLEALGIS